MAPDTASRRQSSALDVELERDEPRAAHPCRRMWARARPLACLLTRRKREHLLLKRSACP